MKAKLKNDHLTEAGNVVIPAGTVMEVKEQLKAVPPPGVNPATEPPTIYECKYEEELFYFKREKLEFLEPQ